MLILSKRKPPINRAVNCPSLPAAYDQESQSMIGAATCIAHGSWLPIYRVAVKYFANNNKKVL
jgi:hypothetical protein